MSEQLQTSAKLVSELTETWEEKEQKSETAKQALQKQNIEIAQRGSTYSLISPKNEKRLINLSEDQGEEEMALYVLQSGMTR